MKKQRIVEINRAIKKIENLYPNNDIIVSYSDYLKVRDYIHYYQFNPIVFQHLLLIANNLWNTEKRINRLLLLEKIKQYFQCSQKNKYSNYNFRDASNHYEFSIETKKLLFNLFRKSFEETNCIRLNQLEEIRKICNFIVYNISFTQAEEEWLCTNWHLHELILNRLLKYSAKSTTISNWATLNFENNALRSRRAELTSWIIDTKPTFEIDQQILIDDFEYMNESDLQAIQNYDDEITAIKIIDQDLSQYLTTKYEFNYFEDEQHIEKVNLSEPELKLHKRPYFTKIDESKLYPIDIPDYELLKKEFYARLPIHQKITMIWSIAYSRIENDTKALLIQKYYCDETHNSILKVCERSKNIKLLNLILEIKDQ